MFKLVWKDVRAFLAAIGNAGMLTDGMCVDRIKSPLGSLTSIGVTAICLFSHGASKTMMLPVAPESKISVGDFFQKG
jgi:hypothetical protein